MKVFKVGDQVSKAMNGDYYLQGKIVQISKSLRRIEVDNGSVFYRYKLTSSWLMNGVWTLVPGTHSKLNPEF